jgi:hypothetical protein
MRLSDRTAALACFLLFVVPLVVYCAWTVPLGQVPDEPTHVSRIESVLHGVIIGHRVTTPNAATGLADAGVIGNFGLALAAASGNGAKAPLPASASAKARLAWVEAIPWSPTPIFISSVNTAAYAPIAYIPAALALGIAISQGARPHDAAIAARFGNVIAFTIVGGLALLLAGRGRIFLLVTLGLPITIWLAGSCNQDGLLIAVAVLALALLTRGGRASFWAGTSLLAVLALQKPPFLTLMVLPLVLPNSSAENWVKRISAALLVVIPAILWSMLVMQHVSVPLLPSGSYHPGPLWPGDPGRIFRSAIPAAQLQAILHHPLRVALLPLTVRMPILSSLIGILGNDAIRLPKWLYTLFALALASSAGALLTTAPPIWDQPIAARSIAGWPIASWRWAVPLVLLAVLGCVGLIYIVEYLTWTPVGYARIDGIQGRYFLPLLPVVTVVLGRILPVPASFGWIWWIAPIIALIALDVRLPGIIAQHFYG